MVEACLRVSVTVEASPGGFGYEVSKSVSFQDGIVFARVDTG
jgi:hypothetical protein